MLAHLSRMFRYVAWADRRTLQSLRATPAAHAEGLPLMAHVLAAGHVWLSRLEGRPPGHAVWPTLDVAGCEALLAENETGFTAYLARLTDGDLGAPVRYRNQTGQEFVTPVLDILTQVVTHGPYHRGQIAKVVARSGGTAINTDFITFAREGG